MADRPELKKYQRARVPFPSLAINHGAYLYTCEALLAIAIRVDGRNLNSSRSIYLHLQVIWRSNPVSTKIVVKQNCETLTCTFVHVHMHVRLHCLGGWIYSCCSKPNAAGLFFILRGLVIFFLVHAPMYNQKKNHLDDLVFQDQPQKYFSTIYFGENTI
jgi:hypothetical protein